MRIICCSTIFCPYYYAGSTLFGISSRLGINLPLMDALLFGTLIAAVDPVAVSTSVHKYYIHCLA